MKKVDDSILIMVNNSALSSAQFNRIFSFIANLNQFYNTNYTFQLIDTINERYRDIELRILDGDNIVSSVIERGSVIFKRDGFNNTILKEETDNALIMKRDILLNQLMNDFSRKTNILKNNELKLINKPL